MADYLLPKPWEIPNPILCLRKQLDGVFFLHDWPSLVVVAILSLRSVPRLYRFGCPGPIGDSWKVIATAFKIRQIREISMW